MSMLRGLFGSSARKLTDQGPAQGPGVPVPSKGPNRMSIIGATLQDVGASIGGGTPGALSKVQDEWRKRHKEELAEIQKGKLRDMMTKLFPNDPEAQLLFAADPESFIKARAKRFEPQTMSGGQTYRDPVRGEVYTAPVVEKFDDRMGYYEPGSGEVRFSEARGPTFQEKTGRMSTEETGRHNRVSEAQGWSNVGLRGSEHGLARDRFNFERGQAGAARVSTPAELAALPSGSLYVGPDGLTRRKP